MKKIKIIAQVYFNQLEDNVNRLIKNEGWVFKTAYSDGKMHFAVLEKDEDK